jgi:hypothetical protein
MWTCPKCGEKVETSFAVCWSCGTSDDGIEDPSFHEEDGEQQLATDVDAGQPTINWVTLIAHSTYPEAQAAKCHLEAVGIPVFLADENLIAMDWLLSNAVGGIKVQVPREEFERALGVLAEGGHHAEAADDGVEEETDDNSEDDR